MTATARAPHTFLKASIRSNAHMHTVVHETQYKQSVSESANRLNTLKVVKKESAIVQSS